jgi:ferredoxin
VRVQIDSDKCQGHGRCYDLAPQLFTEDEEGYGQVIGEGKVSADDEHQAQLAFSNCPESAVQILEEN